MKTNTTNVMILGLALATTLPALPALAQQREGASNFTPAPGQPDSPARVDPPQEQGTSNSSAHHPGGGGSTGTSSSATLGGTGAGGVSPTENPSANQGPASSGGVEAEPRHNNHPGPLLRPRAQEAAMLRQRLAELEGGTTNTPPTPREQETAMLLHRLGELLGAAGAEATSPGQPGTPPGGGTEVHSIYLGGGGEIEALHQAIQTMAVKSGPRTFLGVAATPAPPEIFQQMSNTPALPVQTGLIVNFVDKDSPAAKAGLQEGDVLVKLDDQILMQPEQLVILVSGQKTGDNVKLTYLRKGQLQEATATLATTTSPVAMGRFKIGDADVIVDGNLAGHPLRTFTRTFSNSQGQAGATVSGGVTVWNGGASGSGSAAAPSERNSDSAEIRARLQKIEAALEDLKKSIKP